MKPILYRRRRAIRRPPQVSVKQMTALPCVDVAVLSTHVHPASPLCYCGNA
ncbi:hypothetical protein OKW26_000032 [Paraburkholderia sp. 32]